MDPRFFWPGGRRATAREANLGRDAAALAVHEIPQHIVGWVTDEQAMALALDEARLAPDHRDVPVAAVALVAGEPVARRHNERELRGDPTAHAEILVLRDAADSLGGWRLGDVTLVVTLEPCSMCAGALVAARVGRLVFGASDPKAGAAGSLYNLCSDPRLNHQLPVTRGVLAEASATLLRSFFAGQRDR